MHYVHAIDYLVYGLMQLGEGVKAQRALSEIGARHPIQSTFPAAYALSTIPARIVLEQKQWQRASELSVRAPDYIDWEKFPQVEAISYFARGLGAAKSGNVEAANKNIIKLDELYRKTQKISPNYWAPLVNAQKLTVTAWIDYEKGNRKSALAFMEQAADIEDSLDKNPVTPGAVVPARELLADMLMLKGDFSAALSAYQKSLAINPNRLNSLSGAKTAGEFLALEALKQ
jgi:tetratricopeptide (TPR) repeat protein